MLFFHLLFVLIAPAFAEIFISDDSTQQLLDLLQPRMTKVTQKMAQNITEGHNSRRKFFKRHELEKRSLKRKIEIYVADTYSQPSLDKFHEPLKELLDAGMQDYHRKVTLRKRSGETITEEERRAEAQAHAQEVANQIQSKFRTHSKSKFDGWVDKHRHGKKKNTKTPAASGSTDTITNAKRSETDLEVLEKRALFEKNNKNLAIWGIVFAFLLVPFLFTPFVVGFGGMLAALLWAAFFVGPICNKILFGSWF